MRIFVNLKLTSDGISKYNELIFEERRGKIVLI